MKWSPPSFDANVLLVMEVVKDGENPCLMVVGKFQGALGRVEHPAQDFLSLCPASIPFQHFLFGYGFLVVVSIGSGLCEHAVNGMQYTVADMLTK